MSVTPDQPIHPLHLSRLTLDAYFVRLAIVTCHLSLVSLAGVRCLGGQTGPGRYLSRTIKERTKLIRSVGINMDFPDHLKYLR